MPAGVVTVVRFSPVALLVRVTVAFATTAPLGSVTTPLNSPVPPCPNARPMLSAVSKTRIRALKETARNIRVSPDLHELKFLCIPGGRGSPQLMYQMVQLSFQRCNCL